MRLRASPSYSSSKKYSITFSFQKAYSFKLCLHDASPAMLPSVSDSWTSARWSTSSISPVRFVSMATCAIQPGIHRTVSRRSIQLLGNSSYLLSTRCQTCSLGEVPKIRKQPNEIWALKTLAAATFISQRWVFFFASQWEPLSKSIERKRQNWNLAICLTFAFMRINAYRSYWLSFFDPLVVVSNSKSPWNVHWYLLPLAQWRSK